MKTSDESVIESQLEIAKKVSIPDAIFPLIPDRMDDIGKRFWMQMIYFEPSSSLFEEGMQWRWHRDECPVSQGEALGEISEDQCTYDCIHSVLEWQPRTMFEMAMCAAISKPYDHPAASEIIRRRRGGSWELPHPETAEVLSCTYGIIIFREQIHPLLKLCIGDHDPGYAHFIYAILTGVWDDICQTPIVDLRQKVDPDRWPIFDCIVGACQMGKTVFHLNTLRRIAAQAYSHISKTENVRYYPIYKKLTKEGREEARESNDS